MRFLAAGALIGLLVLSAYALSRSDDTGLTPGLTTGLAPDAAEVGPTEVDRTQAEEAQNPGPGSQPAEASMPEAPPVLGAAPDLVDLDGWLQTEATALSDFGAPVKIVQFWTFGCYNCKNTIPYLQNIYATYHDQGLEIIGVHAPEFAYEADPTNIAAAAVDLGVTWPIALDTDKVNFRSWQSPRRFWPRTYVIDADGNIRFDRIGEGAYEELEATVAYLLADANG